MGERDLADRVGDILAVDAEAYQRRVREAALALEDALDDGAFDNPQAVVGLEYEFYAVGEGTAALQRVPRRLLEYVGFEAELGLHNAEMSTSPQPLSEPGLAAQEAEILARLGTAQECVGAEDMRLVSDGMWTIPPVGESAVDYLTESVEVDGVTVAVNMSDAPRYHAMGQPSSPGNPGLAVEAPHVRLTADTVMPESLATSIQPHYQVPHAADLPERFRYALRVAGPLLALGVNSPFFPPELYDDAPAAEIVDEAWMANRVAVFESVLNDPDGDGKVRFPRDLEDVTEAIDRIVEDDVVVPLPAASSGRFDDDFSALRRKHGTYWRWVRPVFEGETRSSANARVEFRPVGAQPTVRDVVAFQAAFAGLMESLPQTEHPVATLAWEDARANFYAAMRDGIAADLRWVTADGDETADADRLYADLLAAAADGLRRRGLAEGAVEKYLYPMRKRARHRLTPAGWKVDRVREHLADGEDLAAAITGMQRTYVERQVDSLESGSFADWIDAVGYRSRR